MSKTYISKYNNYIQPTNFLCFVVMFFYCKIDDDSSNTITV